MDYSLMIPLIIVSLGLAGVCGYLVYLVDRNNRFLMVERNIDAYEHSIQTRAERNIERKQRREIFEKQNDERELIATLMSGEMTEQQYAKFGKDEGGNEYSEVY